MTTEDLIRLLDRPMLLAPNAVGTFYVGGALWRAFRGLPPFESAVAEDWIGSCIPSRAAARRGETEGLSPVVTDNGPVWLRDIVAAAPGHALGMAAARGATAPMVQLKLVSPRDRIPVHAHPDARFASQHFGSDCGKAEAWILLEGSTDESYEAVAGVGFREHATEELFRDAVRDQDSAALLDLLHTTTVRAGDVVFIAPGVPHFIGGGTLFLEVQEPADLGVLAEWQGFVESPMAATGGLPMELGLSCFRVEPQPRQDVLGAAIQTPRVLYDVPGTSCEVTLLDEHVEEVFGARRLDVQTTHEPTDRRYYVGVVVNGFGWLEGDDWSVEVGRGDAFACAASLRHRYRAKSGTLRVVRAFGPQP